MCFMTPAAGLMQQLLGMHGLQAQPEGMQKVCQQQS